MNKKSEHISKKQNEKNVFKINAKIRTLIAVVAIIECVLLIVFTTYSWIETNSSLIIMNGPKTTVESENTPLNIADVLNYKIDLNANDSSWSDLNSYFSSVKFFEFAKTTTADGKKFFFPRKNNTYAGSTEYRPGDTDDYNTSYLYFDFVLSNKEADAENYDIFFDDSVDFADIFTVNGDFTDSNGHTAQDYKDALKSAMRMSITTKVGNSEVTGIYSVDGDPYYSIPANTSSPTDSDCTQQVEPAPFADYVYKLTNNVISSKKLFVAKKNAETKVSIRIWFEVNDPTFQSVFGYNSSGYYNTDVYKSIPNATVGVKFKLKATANDLRALYFDDYTFSQTAGVNHVTDETSGYSVWFYAYQPYVAATSQHAERTAKWVATELTPDRTNASFTRWSTTDTTISMMEELRSSNRYRNCYFCYGDFSTKTAVYRWALPSAPIENADYTFNAYSYDPNSSFTNNGTWSPTNTQNAQNCVGTWKNGVGLWQDEENYTTMTLLKFKDMTTGVTTGAYNKSVANSPNEKFMNVKAVADNHTHYLVYANNKNFGTSFTAGASTTVAVNDSTNLSLWSSTYTTYSQSHGSIAETNAAMYYDAYEEAFVSYVPSFWLTGDYSGNNKGVTFNYSPSGAFNQNATTQQWYNSMPQQNGGAYVYTALGYTNAYNNNCYVTEYGNDNGAFFTGVGTWGEIEKISFCTDLIDADLSAEYRYMIGISGYSSSGSAWDYYAMVPDNTNMTFYAYVPVGLGSSEGQFSFARYASTSTHSPGAYWYANKRYSHSTFYPVDLDETTYRTSGFTYTHGYWNLSVLVDGTYENLIYATLTDGTGNTYFDSATVENADDLTPQSYAGRDNFGKLEYSYDGETDWQTIADDTTDTLNNSIDRFRFYVPAENQDTVYWRWTPYAGYTITVTSTDPDTVTSVGDTVFTYLHDTSSGIYKLVTEARNATSVVTPPTLPEEPEP